MDDLPLGVAAAHGIGAENAVQQIRHVLLLQQLLGHVLGLGGSHPQTQSGPAQIPEKLRHAGKGPGLIDPDGLVAFPIVPDRLLGLLLRETELLHEHIQQGRPGKAAQSLQRGVQADLVQGIAHRAGDPLHGVEESTVEIEEYGFDRHKAAPAIIK